MVLEPVAAQVYFSPECHAAYAALGFSPSPAATPAGVQLPDGPAYFTSRGSVMGQVSGPVVAAAFGVFNPEAVVPSIEFGWSKVDAPTICAARTRGAVAQLERLLGPSPDGLGRATELLESAVAPLRPEGKPLYAGLLGLGLPGEPLADAWRLADMLREYRGDAHTAAWTSANLDATEIGLLTEPYWGIPLRTYVRTRAWSDEQLDAAEARLVERGLLADGALTDEGRKVRESIETATDMQCTSMLDALGNDGLEELVGLLAPWGKAIRDAGGYPAQGPHELAALSARS
jgi:Helix-turn-helix family